MDYLGTIRVEDDALSVLVRSCSISYINPVDCGEQGKQLVSVLEANVLALVAYGTFVWEEFRYRSSRLQTHMTNYGPSYQHRSKYNNKYRSDT